MPPFSEDLPGDASSTWRSPELRRASSSAGYGALLEACTFFFFLLFIGAVVYFDDIQLAERTIREVPTIFNVRILGVKLMDIFAIGLLGMCIGCLAFRSTMEVTPVHRMVLFMLAIYWYAGVVGYIMGLAGWADFTFWFQDIQQVCYLGLFFVLAFHLLNTSQRWNIFVVAFVSMLVMKNTLLFYKSLTGIGRVIGDWAIRASQNSEFTYLPIIFFVLVVAIVRMRSYVARFVLSLIVLTYLFNALLGVVRTVWVMLMVGSFALLWLLDPVPRKRLLMAGGALGGAALLAISILFPRFLGLAFGYKFASIFDWSVLGDRSNATRTLEMINVFSYSLNHSTYLFGRGLGGWWDDSARRLLPDLGAGLMYKKKFFGTHMVMLSQYFKLGIFAVLLYWAAIFRILKLLVTGLRGVDSRQWQQWVMTGLFVSIVSMFVSNAEFTKTYLILGLAIGVCTRGIVLFTQVDEKISTVS